MTSFLNCWYLKIEHNEQRHEWYSFDFVTKLLTLSLSVSVISIMMDNCSLCHID